MGKAVARPNKTKAARLVEAEQALAWHVAGVEDSEICRRMRISTSTLKRRIKWALSQVVDPTVEEYRNEAAARIRESRRRVYATLAAERPMVDALTGVVFRDAAGQPITEPVCGPSDVAALTGQLIRLDDLEAKLRGGYAPTQVNVSHVIEDAFTRLMAELEQNDPRPAETQESPA